MNIIKGDGSLIKVVPTEAEVDIREFISSPMYDALINPDTERRVDIDTRTVSRLLFAGGLDISLALNEVTKDHRSLTLSTSNEGQVLIPGLIGLESLDYASPEVDDKQNIVRLYCGLMLAEHLTKAKINHDAFFGLTFTKQFSLSRMRTTGQVDSFGSETIEDPKVLANHRRKTIARFASGIVLAKLFAEDDAKQSLTVLKRQLEIALNEDELNFVTLSAVITEGKQPTETFTAEEEGYTQPFGMQLIDAVINGRLRREGHPKKSKRKT